MVRLFIGNSEVELDKSVQFAITKQFEDLTNPTNIINDWSKTVSIPFTQKNNELFGHIYNPDKVIVDVPENLLLNMVNGEEIWQNDNLVHTDKEYPIYYGHPEFLYPVSLYGSGWVPGITLSSLTSYSVIRGTSSTTYEAYISQATRMGKQGFTFTLTSGMTGANRCITLKTSGTTTGGDLPPFVTFDLSGFSDGTYCFSFDVSRFDTANKVIDIKDIVLAKSDRVVWNSEIVSPFGVNFNPTRKMDFRLEWDNDILMVGYAKMNEIKQINGIGTYEITLFGELGKIFQELQKITFDESATESDYIINGSEYVDEAIDRELVYNCWTTTSTPSVVLRKKVDSNYKVTNIIGFAPNNSFNEGFDYKSYQTSPYESTTFEETLGTGFTEDTKVEPSVAIPNGLLPREIGEYRSYLQLPYIYWNQLFQIFIEKAKQITGYDIELDSTWFTSSNPHWSRLVYMLRNLSVLSTIKNITYTNTYDSTITTSLVTHVDNSKQYRYDFSGSTDMQFAADEEQITILRSGGKYFNLGGKVMDGTTTLQISMKVHTNLSTAKTLKIRNNSVFTINVFATDGTNNVKIGQIAVKDSGSAWYPSNTTHIVNVNSQAIPTGSYDWVLVNSGFTFDIPTDKFDDDVRFD